MKRFLVIVLTICAILLAPHALRFTGEAYAANKFWWASCRTGGGDCLDGVDGASLTAGDGALVALDSGSTTPEVYFYRCYASSASESDPLVIAPDSNPGAFRWHLVNIYGASINAVAADGYRRVDVLSNASRTPLAGHNELFPLANKWHLAENGTDVGEILATIKANTLGDSTTNNLQKVILKKAVSMVDHDWQGTSIVGTAGENLAQGDVVYKKLNSSAWKYYKYDCNGTDKLILPSGIATAAITSGNDGIILLKGIMRDDTWALSPSADSAVTVYASGTAGGVTLTAPSTTGDEIIVIGLLVAANTIETTFGYAWVEK
jgi:hypothetical protein